MKKIIATLDQAKLPQLIQLKYSSITDGMDKLGGVNEVRDLFLGFQKHLYESRGQSND